MSIERMFPELSHEQIVRNVAESWDLTGPLPFPKRSLLCGACLSDEYQARTFTLNEAGEKRVAHRMPWRMDVSFKCVMCGYVWTHGIALTNDQAMRFQWTWGQRRLHWREAKDRYAGVEKP